AVKSSPPKIAGSKPGNKKSFLMEALQWCPEPESKNLKNHWVKPQMRNHCVNKRHAFTCG
ncbi:hypothetical protein, partial [Comamonas kerstersii]|uniref:hypothetical protein n=1 Tax=Comamonas kerstersii TaxID=225992 RepID=UPI0026DB1A98